MTATNVEIDTIRGVVMNRVTHAYEGPLAVFLIGVRVHQPWRLRVVRQVVSAMPRMVAELERNKAAAARGEEESLGYLSSRVTFGGRGTTTIQYWRSVDDIYVYANAARLEHRPAWVEFYRLAKRAPDVVTIWHETFEIARAESVYAGPRPFGLADVGGTIPVSRRGDTARDRIRPPA